MNALKSQYNWGKTNFFMFPAIEKFMRFSIKRWNPLFYKWIALE